MSSKNDSPKLSADVLILGAGIAGLTAARELRASGKEVILLEKSRGLSGRAATRRWDHRPVDHGAQFFTARSPAFRAQVEQWLTDNVCFTWAQGFHRHSAGTLIPPARDKHPRYACLNGMSSLGHDLAGPDPTWVLRETPVTTLEARERLWTARSADGRSFSAPTLILTPPPAQSAALLQDAAPVAADALLACQMSPCLALAVRYPRRPLPWLGIQALEHPVISWIGHDSSKRPSLHRDSTILTIHASTASSERHFQADHQNIANLLLGAASEITGEDLSSPESFFLQRWRYALGQRGDNPPLLVRYWDVPAPLVLAGDAIAGGKIEGAWLSGKAAAQAVLEKSGQL